MVYTVTGYSIAAMCRPGYSSNPTAIHCPHTAMSDNSIPTHLCLHPYR
jgi:hypothetical protein